MVANNNPQKTGKGAPVEHRMTDARFLQSEGKTQMEIAEILGVTDRTVRNYLKTPPRERIKPVRISKLDPYREYIQRRVDDNPGVNGELILDSLRKMGYTGKRTVLKDYLTILRRQKYQSTVIRYETEPGFQAQVDWVEFGMQSINGKCRKLYAFTMTLGYSRLPFVRFTTDMKSSTVLACHVEAFHYYGGVPAEILYDNMKTAWVYDGERWRPNKRLAAFACHYGFIPRRCQVRRPETKGKVERFNQYLEDNFFAGLERRDFMLDELNEAVLSWIERIKMNKISGIGESRADRFDRERSFLRQLPDTAFDCRDAITLIVLRESCVTWKTNRYSVNPSLVGREVILRPSIFASTADIFSEDTFIKTIALENEGAMRRVIDPVDRDEIRKRWEIDRARQTRLRYPKKVTVESRAFEVSVRNPACYDALIPGGGL
jgi:transposase